MIFMSKKCSEPTLKLMIANFKANDFKANNISTASYVFKFIRIFSREYFFIDYVQISIVTTKLILLIYNENITSGTINHYVKHINKDKAAHKDAAMTN